MQTNASNLYQWKNRIELLRLVHMVKKEQYVYIYENKKAL